MKETKLQEGLTNITNALKRDEQFYYAYKANIAMAFKDRVSQYKKEKNKKVLSNEDIHIIANEAADNFLKLLCK